MSIGLFAREDRTRIYLACDSKGTGPGGDTVECKAFLLQSSPAVALVCTGGMPHWRLVRDLCAAGQVCATFEEAADRVKELLTTEPGGPQVKAGNNACARICGFSGPSREPRYYPIDLVAPADMVPRRPAQNGGTDPIGAAPDGIGQHVGPAVQKIQEALRGGADLGTAMRDGVKEAIRIAEEDHRGGNTTEQQVVGQARVWILDDSGSWREV